MPVFRRSRSSKSDSEERAFTGPDDEFVVHGADVEEPDEDEDEDEPDLTAEEEAAKPEELDALAERFKKIAGHDLPRGRQYPHAGNIAKKLKEHSGKDTALGKAIDAILREYVTWQDATLSVEGTDERKLIAKKIAAFEKYHSFLDTKQVDQFDSRGALVSSALEEFCYYLLKPILDTFPDALLGKQDTFQGIYFTASSFEDLLKLPTVHTPVNTLDFVIGADMKGTVKTKAAEEKFPIRLPAVAVECKGYLDRPRFIESQNMARAIKSAFPQCQYILVAQCLKLNLQKIGVAPDIDGIYVWRRMQNIDRKIRRKNGTPLDPIYVPAVEDFYERVKRHLTETWVKADPLKNGILK
jgi:hypothetical protein